MAARAKPELLCPVESTEDSPLPDGRVELSIVASGYIDSGFAIATSVTQLKRAAPNIPRSSPFVSFEWELSNPLDDYGLQNNRLHRLVLRCTRNSGDLFGNILPFDDFAENGVVAGQPE